MLCLCMTFEIENRVLGFHFGRSLKKKSLFCVAPTHRAWASSLSLRRPQTLRSGNISLFGLASRLHNDAPAVTQTCRHRQRGLQHTGENGRIYAAVRSDCTTDTDLQGMGTCLGFSCSGKIFTPLPRLCFCFV